MIRAVIDTNVVVSGLLTPAGNEALDLLGIHQGLVRPCFSEEILEEYTGVLARPKFAFPADEIAALLMLVIMKSPSMSLWLEKGRSAGPVIPFIRVELAAAYARSPNRFERGKPFGTGRPALPRLPSQGPRSVSVRVRVSPWRHNRPSASRNTLASASPPDL